LLVRVGDRMEEVDARPSDGIALALRTQTPIYVSDKIVLEEASSDKKHADDGDMDKFRQFLDSLKPSDFK
jgi:hypothetical protein